MLPLEKKAHEIRRSDGLDLLAQLPDGAAMNPGEQPAMTPLKRRGLPFTICHLRFEIRILATRPKLAAEDLALAFETDQRGFQTSLRQMQPLGQFPRRRWTDALHPAQHNRIERPFIAVSCQQPCNIGRMLCGHPSADVRCSIDGGQFGGASSNT